jgi:hypothetical protein
VTATSTAWIIASYAVLTVLLLSLNFTSLWHWWVKLGAILVSALACIGSYFAMVSLLGWPTSGAMPERFNLVATRIIEPDVLRGTKGRIYLWIEEIDENQVIITPPRAFEVPYEVDLSVQVAEAQSELNGGSNILGQFAATEAESGERQATPRAGADTGDFSAGTALDQSSGEGGTFADTTSANTLTFSDMPPVNLPSKPMLVD